LQMPNNNFIRYKKFIRQRVFGAMNVCKEVNTFTTISCNYMYTLIRGERHPKCEYRGHKSTRKIVVGCAGNWPTHYEEGVIV
uniref:Ribonuclease A-domain domain-containing protein n=1 Tax=Sinocyclocheilus grahami TaxID=75366 RepID=A0A672SIC5_SINGR